MIEMDTWDVFTSIDVMNSFRRVLTSADFGEEIDLENANRKAGAGIISSRSPVTWKLLPLYPIADFYAGRAGISSF